MILHPVTTLNRRKVSNYLKNRASYLWSRVTKTTSIWGMPTFLSIEVSSVCNLKCPECPCGNRKIDRDTHYMDLNLYNNIIEQSKKHIHTLQLFFQGEPLLHPNFIELIQKANQNGIYTITSTNAQLIDRNKAKAIIEAGLNHIIISIDGTTQEVYETYRVGGSLKLTLQTIDHLNYWKQKLNKKNPIIEIQMVVFSHNEKQIEDFKALGKKYHVDHITLKSAQIYDYALKTDLIPKNKKYTRYIFKNDTWQLKHKNNNHCYRQWSGAVITANGLLIPCCFDKLAQHPFGSLKEDSIQKLWHSDKAIAFRKQILTKRSAISICNNCSE